MFALSGFDSTWIYVWVPRMCIFNFHSWFCTVITWHDMTDLSSLLLSRDARKAKWKVALLKKWNLENAPTIAFLNFLIVVCVTVVVVLYSCWVIRLVSRSLSRTERTEEENSLRCDASGVCQNKDPAPCFLYLILSQRYRNDFTIILWLLPAVVVNITVVVVLHFIWSVYVTARITTDPEDIGQFQYWSCVMGVTIYFFLSVQNPDI